MLVRPDVGRASGGPSVTARVVARWLTLIALASVMFALGWAANEREEHTKPPAVTVLRFYINHGVWLVPCVLADWPHGQVSCDWEGATREGEHA